MSTRDGFEVWLDARRQVPVPDGFAERVMAAVRDVPAKRRGARVLAPLALAAGLVLLAAYQASLVGAFWLAMSGVAQ
jgi:hypothetical protein